MRFSESSTIRFLMDPFTCLLVHSAVRVDNVHLSLASPRKVETDQQIGVICLLNIATQPTI